MTEDPEIKFVGLYKNFEACQNKPEPESDILDTVDADGNFFGRFSEPLNPNFTSPCSDVSSPLLEIHGV